MKWRWTLGLFQRICSPPPLFLPLFVSVIHLQRCFTVAPQEENKPHVRPPSSSGSQSQTGTQTGTGVGGGGKGGWREEGWITTSTAPSILQLAFPKSRLGPALTFGDAERVVAAGHKVVERHKQVAVILAGSGQQVLLGVPAGRFRQTLSLGVRLLKSFCEDGEKRSGWGRFIQSVAFQIQSIRLFNRHIHWKKMGSDLCHFLSGLRSCHDLVKLINQNHSGRCSQSEAETRATWWSHGGNKLLFADFLSFIIFVNN